MSGSLVAVDIGNTFLHAAAFGDQHDPIAQAESIAKQGRSGRFSHANIDRLDVLPEISDWFVSSVNQAGLARLKDWLVQHRPETRLHILSAADFPIQIGIDNPGRVGVDRLAAATAVNQLRTPGRHAIIVDAGTATTVDLVDCAGCFRGGVILAGSRILSLALAEQTDALPRVEPPTSPPEVLGDSTENAIASGLYWGSLGAVRECVSRMRQGPAADAELFVTGGGASWLRHLEDARHAGDLTLRGVAIVGRELLAGTAE